MRLPDLVAVPVTEADLPRFLEFYKSNLESEVARSYDIQYFKDVLRRGSKLFYVSTQQGVNVGTFGIETRTLKKSAKRLMHPIMTLLVPHTVPELDVVSVSKAFSVGAHRGLRGKANTGAAIVGLVRLAEQTARGMGIRKLYVNVGSANPFWRKTGARKENGAIGYKPERAMMKWAEKGKQIRNLGRGVLGRRLLSPTTQRIILSKKL